MGLLQNIPGIGVVPSSVILVVRTPGFLFDGECFNAEFIEKAFYGKVIKSKTIKAEIIQVML